MAGHWATGTVQVIVQGAELGIENDDTDMNADTAAQQTPAFLLVGACRVPWSAGGQTVISNLPHLCPSPAEHENKLPHSRSVRAAGELRRTQLAAFLKCSPLLQLV